MTREELKKATADELIKALHYCGYNSYCRDWREKIRIIEEIRTRLMTPKQAARETIMKLQTYKLFEDGELLVCRDDVLKLLEQEPCEDKITEWKKNFKEYVNALSMPRDDYKGIMEYIDELPATSEPCEDVKTEKHACCDRKNSE